MAQCKGRYESIVVSVLIGFTVLYAWVMCSGYRVNVQHMTARTVFTAPVDGRLQSSGMYRRYSVQLCTHKCPNHCQVQTLNNGQNTVEIKNKLWQHGLTSENVPNFAT